MKNVALAAIFALAPMVMIEAAHSADATKWELNSADAIRSNLQQYKGKVVTLRLSSGEDISGTVTEVGTSAVHLSALTGKEFYDAMVPLNHIVALTVRAKS